MKKKIRLLTAALLIGGMFTGVGHGEGVPVSKYLEDPQHADGVLGYYLNALLSGITLANDKAAPKLFCVPDAAAEQGIYVMIDRRIAKLQKQNKLSSDMSLDSIIMDMLVEEFPCN